MTNLLIDVLSGEAVRGWLEEAGSLRAWDDLYQNCRWRTPYLSRGFFETWFAHYGSDWKPILVVGRDSTSTVRALMPLAGRGDLVTGAGAHQAEYQGWLGDEIDAEDFVSQALTALCTSLPIHEIRLRYLSPQMPLRAIGVGAQRTGRAITRVQPRPLMNLDSSAIMDVLRKSSNRSKLNRLKRDGDVVFRQIVRDDELVELFPRICGMYDSRQGAINDVCPFREDNQKASFHLDWFRRFPDQLHVAVTFVAGQPVAASIGVVSDVVIHLAILAYSPLHARSSPGKLHLYQAGLSLAEEGKLVFDLTPGGDSWKERFATDHDEVLEITAFARSKDARAAQRRLKRDAMGRALLAKLHLSPSRVRFWIARLRNISLAGAIARLKRLVPQHREYRVYRMNLEQLKVVHSSVTIGVNDLRALVCFRPAYKWQSRQRFLAEALSRIEAGETVYTVTDGETLVHWGWLVNLQEEAYFSEVGCRFRYPEAGAVLYEFFSMPGERNRGYYQATIGRMLADVKRAGETSVAYISVLSDNHGSRHVIEKVGFQYLCSLHRFRFLWYERHWRVPR